ncbi:phosphatase PAP2 family protein [Rickettsiaceae bacterium]|nr:phosphatase PAP2 family protein [Rickettsiaceae bacterium]
MPIYYELVRIGTCYALFGLGFAALKFSINLPRPFCSLSQEEFITIANIYSERCLSSFPSAHTGLSILTTYCLWKYMNNILRVMSCIMIFLVAISRITLAMHYPTDILYSALITMFIILLANFFYNLLKDSVIKIIGKFIMKFIFNTNSA